MARPQRADELLCLWHEREVRYVVESVPVLWPAVPFSDWLAERLTGELNQHEQDIVAQALAWLLNT